MCLYGHLCTRLSRTPLAALHVHRIEIPYRAFPERVGPRIVLLESVDYFGTSDYFSGRIKGITLMSKTSRFPEKNRFQDR